MFLEISDNLAFIMSQHRMRINFCRGCAYTIWFAWKIIVFHVRKGNNVLLSRNGPVGSVRPPEPSSVYINHKEETLVLKISETKMSSIISLPTRRKRKRKGLYVRMLFIYIPICFTIEYYVCNKRILINWQNAQHYVHAHLLTQTHSRFG